VKLKVARIECNRLTAEVLGRSLDELPTQTRRLLLLAGGPGAGAEK